MDQSSLESFRGNIRVLELILADLAKISAFTGGISITQFHIVYALMERKSCSMVDLADALSIEKSKVSRTIDQLVKKNLVNRDIDPDNRRYSVVSLTSKGMKLTKDMNKSHNALFQKTLKNLSQSQKKAFLAAFDQFVQALKAELTSL